MTVNVELLDRTLAHIEAHPEEWNQGTYRCETGLCFAGWACDLSGAQWAVSDPDALHSSCVVAVADDDPGVAYDFDGRRIIHAADRARRLLRLNARQTADLFAGHNTLAALRRIVADLKAGAS